MNSSETIEISSMETFTDSETKLSSWCPQFKMQRPQGKDALVSNKYICIHNCPQVSKGEVSHTWKDDEENKVMKLQTNFTIYDFLLLECGSKTQKLTDPLSKYIYDQKYNVFFGTV